MEPVATASGARVASAVGTLADGAGYVVTAAEGREYADTGAEGTGYRYCGGYIGSAVG